MHYYSPIDCHAIESLNLRHLVGYLTLVSDLDLAPDTDQFVASPPVRYMNINSHFFQGHQYFLHYFRILPVPIFEFGYDGLVFALENFGMCRWLKFDRGWGGSATN